MQYWIFWWNQSSQGWGWWWSQWSPFRWGRRLPKSQIWFWSRVLLVSEPMEESRLNAKVVSNTWALWVVQNDPFWLLVRVSWFDSTNWCNSNRALFDGCMFKRLTSGVRRQCAGFGVCSSKVLALGYLPRRPWFDLIQQWADIDALVWFDRSIDRIVLVTGLRWLPSFWCLPCFYQKSLSLTICISKRAALASCSGFCSGLDTTLGHYAVIE